MKNIYVHAKKKFMTPHRKNNIKYDLNFTQNKYKMIAISYLIDMTETINCKEYIDLVENYRLCCTMEQIQFVTSIIKVCYPKVVKFIFNYIIENNLIMAKFSKIDIKTIYKNLPIKTINDEFQIYDLLKEQNVLTYNMFMSKKFSTSLFNIILTLNKICHHKLIYTNKKLYCFTGSKWTDNPNIIIPEIQQFLINYFIKESRRVNYNPDLSKLENIKFIRRVYNNYYRRSYSNPSRKIKFNKQHSEYVYFSNVIYGIPGVHYHKYFNYNPKYYNTISTNYEYNKPAEKYINDVMLLLNLIIDQSEHNTLLNLIASTLLNQPFNFIVVLRGENEGKELLINLVLEMLGDYATKISYADFIDKKFVGDKRSIFIPDYEQEIINNDTIQEIFDDNKCSTYFLNAKQEPIFKKKLNYNETKKIIEITFKNDLKNNQEFVKFNNPKFIQKHRCALFRLILKHCKNNYKHHTWDSSWYRDNVSAIIKQKITKYQSFDPKFLKYF